MAGSWHCCALLNKLLPTDNSIGPYTAQGNNEVRFLENLAGAEGLEPTTLGFGDRCSTN